MQNILPDSAQSSSGRLQIGGCEASELAQRFGTPLVVVDRTSVEKRAQAFAGALGADHVFFAAKSFCCVAICELLERQGIGIDVCTGGELATALAGGFSADRIIFHGNNKSMEELEAARDVGVGRVVADSFEELDRIAKAKLKSRLLIRVTPGVEAHTHEFVQTGQEDSKFGFTLSGDVALEAARRALDISGSELVGLHAHIGSQIFELSAFDLAVERIAEFAARLKAEIGWEPREVNLGGGLGIAHTRDEITPDPAEGVTHIRSAIERHFPGAGLAVPDVLVEPGRSIVGTAAVTLYEVGTVKVIPGVRTYVAVDGGMSDNIRPALYGARYEAFLANRMDAPLGPRVTICGKHCESGDVLIKDVHLPEDVTAGDLLCIPATGAYTYSMASNYNRVPRPAIVLVADGDARVIVERETEGDLLRQDRRLDGSRI